MDDTTALDPHEHDTDVAGFSPSRVQVAALVLALLFAAAAVSYGIGARSADDEVPAASSVDVGFLHDMIAHHEQALQLSSAELSNGVEADVRSFAREILTQQSYEIGVMERQLEVWGYTRASTSPMAMRWMGGDGVRRDAMPGLASDAELTLLAGLHGRDADALFIPLMQDHHGGGVHMAEYAAERAATSFVRDLARRMAEVQVTEIRELAAARVRAGLPERPAGWEPDAIPSGAIEADGHDHH